MLRSRTREDAKEAEAADAISSNCWTARALCRAFAKSASEEALL
jgi:hypothetical protein